MPEGWFYFTALHYFNPDLLISLLIVRAPTRSIFIALTLMIWLVIDPDLLAYPLWPPTLVPWVIAAFGAWDAFGG